MNASNKESAAAIELQAILDAQRSAFRREGPVALATRVDRLDRCIALLVDNKEAICEAVSVDFGCRSKYVTLMTDIMNSVGSLKFVKKTGALSAERGYRHHDALERADKYDFQPPG